MARFGSGLTSIVVGAVIGAQALCVSAAEPLGRVADYKLVEIDGRERTPADSAARKGVVYAFLGLECPVANGYAPQIQRLADRFAEQGVELVGVYSERGVTTEAARKHGEEYALRFTRLLDGEQRLAAQAGVARVPTFVVVAADGAIVYRGRIDDRWSPDGRRRDIPRTHELADAVDALVAGKEVATPTTPVFGCPLVYSKPTTAK